MKIRFTFKHFTVEMMVESVKEFNDKLVEMQTHGGLLSYEFIR